MSSTNSENCWLAKKGLRLSRGSTCLYHFAGRAASCWSESFGAVHVRDDCSCCTQAWSDHLDVWLRAGKPVVLTSQPCGLSAEAAQAAVTIAQKLGLDLEIDARSWHNPGTLLLRFSRPGFDLFARPTRAPASARIPPASGSL